MLSRSEIIAGVLLVLFIIVLAIMATRDEGCYETSTVWVYGPNGAQPGVSTKSIPCPDEEATP